MVTPLKDAFSSSAPRGCVLAPGTPVGEYYVDGIIGEGGMATVYAATHPIIGRRVAIKVMSRAPSADQTVAVSRFVQEARAISAIGHPNIVDVFAFGALPDGRSYFVMELLAGETLFDLLGRRPLGLRETITILLQVCDALTAAHDKRIVHRDLKPENLFVLEMRDGRRMVKLLDFGLAKLVGADAVRHTSTGCVMGTPSYMSPEQVLCRDIDCPSDIYSLGVVAYETLTGHVPFEADAPFELFELHVKTPPTPLTDVMPGIPEALNRLVLRMLAKEPHERPSIVQVASGLQAVAAALAANAAAPERAPRRDQPPAATVPAMTSRRGSRHARAAVTACAALCLFASAFALRDHAAVRTVAPRPRPALVLTTLPLGRAGADAAHQRSVVLTIVSRAAASAAATVRRGSTARPPRVNRAVVRAHQVEWARRRDALVDPFRWPR
jgi:eukaryotic-like serine/threonine-protein kinase